MDTPNGGVTSRIHWNHCLEVWVFEDLLGHYQTGFPNCGWFEHLYGRLDKKKIYVIHTPQPNIKEVIVNE